MAIGDWQKANARPAHERVLARTYEDENGCWIWTGGSAGRGDKYGRITVGSRTDGSRRSRGTHEVVYEALIGPVPEGLELDHYVCHQTLCCNPWHLDPVPHRVNAQRMVLSDVERARRSEWMKSVNRQRWAS